MKRINGFLVLCLATAIGGQAHGDVVEYEVTFNATWSNATHPLAYPSSAHFSGLIGGTHNANVSFWQKDKLASPGMERMAETGSKSPLDKEVQAAIDAGNAFSLISGGGIGRSPGTVSQRFEISSVHPLATVVSMIAPSPDWFVGTSGLNLRSQTKWLSVVVVDLRPYDAGTDSGLEFQSADIDTAPRENIRVIDGPPFHNALPLGTFTFRLVSLPGDLNRSGDYDPGDVDLLCANLGSDPLHFDFTNNNQVNGADVAFLVNSLMGTRPGDTDLDGQVSFEDFLTLADHFGGAGTWRQGDFDCDGEVQFPDFLQLAAHFGFQRVANASVTPVPEPRGMWLVTMSMVMLGVRTARRGRSSRRG